MTCGQEYLGGSERAGTTPEVAAGLVEEANDAHVRMLALVGLPIEDGIVAGLAVIATAASAMSSTKNLRKPSS